MERLFIGCARSLLGTFLEKKFFFSKLKKMFESTERGIFLFFALETDFLNSILPKNKPGWHSNKRGGIMDNSFHAPMNRILLNFSSKKILPQFFRQFEPFIEKVFLGSLTLKFFSSLGPNRDSFDLKKTNFKIKNIKEKFKTNSIKGSSLFLGLSCNLSKANKNNFFRFWKFLPTNYRKKRMCVEFPFLKRVLETGLWEKKLSRTLFSFKKAYSRDRFKFFPENSTNFFLFSICSENFSNSESFLSVYRWFCEKLRKISSCLEFLEKYLSSFKTRKDKRDLFLTREDGEFLPTSKGLITIANILIHSRKPPEPKFLFLRNFFSSPISSGASVILWDTISAFFYSLSLFFKIFREGKLPKKLLFFYFKKTLGKLKKCQKLLFEKKPSKRFQFGHEYFLFSFSRDFLRVVWIFNAKKKIKKKTFNKNQKFFDRSEMITSEAFTLPHRIFNFLDFLEKNIKTPLRKKEF